MEKLSLKKTLKNDYTLIVSLCCILVGGIIFILYDKFGIIVSKRGIKSVDKDNALLLILLAALVLFGLLNTLRRYIRIRGIFERGVSVTATVYGTSFIKDRGRINYRYSYEGMEYQSHLAVSRNKETQALENGMKVFVLADERNPKHSLILALYSDNVEQPPAFFYSAGQAELILAELKNQTRLPSVAIHAHKTEIPLPLTASKFGGLPYWKPGEPYPTGSDGKKLVLLAQLNMAEIPPMKDFPTAGLLQFFIGSGDDMYGADLDDPTGQKNWRVVYHESVDGSITEESVRALGIQTAKSLREGNDDETEEILLPLYDEFALSFEKTESCITPASDDRFVDAVRRAADALGLPFPEDAPSGYELFSEDTYNELYEQGTGHKIGGYPSFTQYDPRSSGDTHDMLLFQMDSDYSGSDEIMWGDMGVANFFISREALLRRDFSDILYNWDCG